MNNTTRLEERNWMALLHHVLWNNTFQLDAKLSKSAGTEENIDIIREHVMGGITEENIEFLRHVANLACYAELSGVFWYYPYDVQRHLLEALPAFDPFTLCSTYLLEIHPFEHVAEMVLLRRNEFVLAHTDDYKESELLTKIMLTV